MKQLRNDGYWRGVFNRIVWIPAVCLLSLSRISAGAAEWFLTTASDLAAASSGVQPGDTLTMQNGFWLDADILFTGIGTAANPITLRAETPGQVILSGSSRLRIAGSYLVVEGLKFANGYLIAGDVIAFRNGAASVANNCRLTQCAVIDYNPDDANEQTTWVSLYGTSNQVDNCYFIGKNNLGSTLVVWVDTRPDQPNYHRILQNYFGRRPALGVNGGETIRIGTSDVSMNLSRCAVEANYFEQCNGDSEIVSSKSCENMFLHNTFAECAGSLTLRHGNRGVVAGNFFLGRSKPNTGGIRISGEDHKIYNNYLADLAGATWNAPLCLMQGLANSPLNGYFQVKRAEVAFNTIVNCQNNILIGLPATLTGTTNATTLPPADCALANNVVVSQHGKLVDQRINPLNMIWEGNMMYGVPLDISPHAGISFADPLLVLGGDGLWRPGAGSPALGASQGIYEYVSEDMDGQLRPQAKDIGSDQASAAPVSRRPLTGTEVGPFWMRPGSAIVNWSSPPDISYGKALSAAQLNASANVPGTFDYVPPAGTLLNAGAMQPLTVIFSPLDSNRYSMSTQFVTINVIRATPVITWPSPPVITYGASLTSGQLNATANAAGTFIYNPPIGTVLNAGVGHRLATTFAPADTANYQTVTKSVSLDVLQAEPEVYWPDPAPIEYGIPLSASQLNAVATKPGSFVYDPPEGTVLSTGTGQVLSVTWIPTDPVNYSIVNRTVSIDVTSGDRIIPVITWEPPADILYGTALHEAQLNAAADVSGTFVYNPPPGTVLPRGNGQVLSVTFTPDDTTTYVAISTSVVVNVASAVNNAALRIAYLIPANRAAQSNAVAHLQSALMLYRDWFRDQMEQNGFGQKSFTIETEANGVTPRIHVVPVSETDSNLRNDLWGNRIVDAARTAGVTIGTPGELWWLIPEIHLENPDGSISGQFDYGYSYGGSADAPGVAVGSSTALALLQPSFLTNGTTYDGLSLPEIGPFPLSQNVSFPWFEGSSLSTLSSSALGAGLRQIAAAMGTDHDFRNDENFNGNLTGYGFRGIRGALYPKLYPYNDTRLSYGQALAFDVSPYLNPGRPHTDFTKPSVTIGPANSTATVNGMLEITFTASDAGGLHAALLSWNKDSIRMLVDEMHLTGTNCTRTFSTPYYDPGQTNEYTLSVYDLQGNKESATTRIVRMAGINHAPRPFITVLPASAGVGEDVVFDASSSFDPDQSATLMEVEWDMDGDGIFDTPPTSTLTFTNRYLSLGTRLIRARLTDPAGDVAVSAPVAVNIILCSAALSPQHRTHGYGATTNTVSVTTSGKCRWYVQNTNQWITILSDTSATGRGTVVYAIEANATFQERSGLIMIADQLFHVTQQPVVCTYSLSPASRFHGYTAGSGTLKVSTKTDCPWSVVNTNHWIMITGVTNGVGTMTLSYTVADNPSASSRSGVLRIADQIFSVGQWGTVCEYVVWPASQQHSELSETGAVNITTSGGCAWTAVNTNDWITITSPTNGLGDGSSAYRIAANSNAIPRLGTLTIAGKPITVFQAGCTYAISPSSHTHGYGSEAGEVAVTTGGACDWTLVNTNDWIRIASSLNGMGNATVSYTVDANPFNQARAGVLSIAGKPFHVVQLGVPCTYELWPTNGVHGEGMDVGEISVWTGDLCSWDVINTNDWITVLWTTTGAGNGSMAYYVEANTGLERSGTLSIAGVPLAIRQARGLRLARIGDMVVASGQTNCLAVELESQGNENAVAFSLCYDTNLVAFESAQLGGVASAGSLTLDASQQPLGRIGFMVQMPPGWAINAGTQAVVDVCFRGVLVTGKATAQLDMCDLPTPRQLVDVIGRALPIEFLGGTVKVLGECSLGEAVDAPLWVWTSDGDALWTCQTNVTYDGEDAVVSGTVADGNDSRLETTVTGPGTVSFWWKVSSEPSNDELRFYIDGSKVTSISGEVDWQWQSFSVPAGSQVLQWRYRKNSSLTAGQDCGWVDEIRFEPAAPAITAQPVNLDADFGATVSFSVAATGTPPLSYQWRWNGSDLTDGDLISGATTATLRLSSVAFSQAGTYSVEVRNSMGSVASSEAVLTVSPIVSLAEALDTADWIWTTTGTPAWAGRSDVNHDGTDAARSGAIAHGQNCRLQTTVVGPGTLSFWWKVSSEPNKDILRFYAGGSEQASISGEVDWRMQTFNIGSGSQVLEWRYQKNSSTSAGLDRGWVDQVEFMPLIPAITAQPSNQSVDAGTTARFTVAATGTLPLSYEWRWNGVALSNGGNVSGATTTALTISSVLPEQAGQYSVVVANTAGIATSANALLEVATVTPLAESLDTTNLTWTTSGSDASVQPWVGQSGITHDGVDAARSGFAPDSEYSSLITTLSGPGSLSFWWKVSSESGNDQLRLYINGSQQTSISGEVDWQWRVLNISSGSQTVEWRYRKNSSVAVGQDRGWVDQVLYLPNNVPVAPIIAMPPVSQSVVAGTAANLSVGAVGTTPMSYQWQCNGTNLANGGNVSGVSTTNLTLIAVQAAQEGNYTVVVRNAVGEVASAGAQLTVVAAPVITNQPASQDVVAGTTVNFTVAAMGMAPLSYQWRRNGTNLVNAGNVSGVTTASLRLSSATAAQAGAYSVIVSNPAGAATSEEALLNVSTVPAITIQPASQQVVANNMAVFSVGANGTAPLRYQWRFNGVPLDDGANIIGATTASLTLASVQPAQAGAYSVVVSNAVGSATSANALLTVLIPPTISTQPASQSVAQGTTVNFNATASGTMPLSYQWRFKGTHLFNGGSVSGATTPTLTLVNVHPSHSGDYSLVVSNAGGVITSSNAILSMAPGLTLAEAMNAPYLSWNSSMSAPWMAQTNISHDGSGAVASGTITHNQSTWLETSVAGPGTVRFWWKTSSETNRDILSFTINGVERARLSGEAGWQWATFLVEAGTYALRWTYAKDASGSSGQDRAWVDELEFIPTFGPAAPVITGHPASQEVQPGATVTFTVAAGGTTPLGYQWYFNGAEMADSQFVSGAMASTLTLANVQPAQSGLYSVVVRNAYGNDVSPGAFLAVTPVIPLAEALDANTLSWIVGGYSPWQGQAKDTYDKVDAAQSGALPNSQTNWMETYLRGPASVSFFWKVSSQTNQDRLRFYVDEVEQANISGSVDWSWRTFNLLTATNHILRWAYSKDANGVAGLDRGWVDQVLVSPMGPLITNASSGLTVVDVGTTVRLNVNAAGTPHFSYQWRCNGTNLIEAGNVYGAISSSRLLLSNALPHQSGAYSVVVSNAGGIAISSDMILTVLPGLPLPEALNTPEWTWIQGGYSFWVGQTNVSHDGIMAARNGSLPDGRDAWMETTVVGPGTLSFWWKVSSQANRDILSFSLNDTVVTNISGAVDWHQRTYDLPSGSQALRWTYSKDSLGTNGLDSAWVDQVVFGPSPPQITNQPVSRTVDAGSSVSFAAGSRGTPPLSYQWRLNGTPLTEGETVLGATTAVLTLANVQPGQAGTYSVVVSNAAGIDTSIGALLTVIPISSLAEALETTNWFWTLSGSPAWVGQSVVSHDTVDAARIAGVANSQSASMQTTVTGPGIVSFWWKVSSETNNDILVFYIGNTEQARISGDVDWQQKSFSIPAGSQVLRWTYSKNSSGIGGQDRAWVDEIHFTPMAVAITSQPANQTADTGETASFSVAVSGTPPLSYQWRWNGVNLDEGGFTHGTTNASLILSNLQPWQVGKYSVLVANSAGSLLSSNALLTVTPLVSLSEALDIPGWLWTTTGTPPWVGQPIVSFDGMSAARSGAVGHGQTGSMQTTATGAGTVSFWWKVSSETNNDTLTFYVNGTERARISGEVDWQRRSFDLPAGSQALKWTYSKNGSVSSGQDRGWVDQVEFNIVPPTITSPPESRHVEAGTTVTLSVSAVGTPPLSYAWWLNGVDVVDGGTVSGALTSSLTLANVRPEQAGNYSVLVYNMAGFVLSSHATLTVSPVLSLAEALDATNLVWTTSGSDTSVQPWAGQSVVTHDGIDAARSGMVPNSEYASLQTTVTGPGTLSYWWKVSSESGNDQLRLYIDGSQQTSISGEVDWQWRVFNISSGSQTVQWRYRKNSSGTAGQDQGWVDQVRFVPASVPTAPIVAMAPASQSVVAGTTISFNVGLVGTTPITCQWQWNGTNLVNGGNVSGATTTNLTLTAVQAAQGGFYTVVASNSVGTVTSAGALLTVLAAPTITSHPASQSALAGATIHFTVGAMGLPPLSYQWLFNSVNLVNGGTVSGATSTNLILSNAQEAQAGVYSVVVSNSAGRVTSAPAQLLVSAPPVITSPPAGLSVPAGATATFSVHASGSGPLSYRWRLNGATLADGGGISGASTATLTLANVQPDQVGAYSVVVANALGSVVSSAALLTTIAAPAITSHPVSQSVAEGATIALDVEATGTAPLGYQWRFHGTNLMDGGKISGATTARLRVSNAQWSDAGEYTVVVGNGVGHVISVVALIHVITAPTITSQSQDQSVAEGATVLLAVTADGTDPLGYQWRFNGVNLANGGTVIGATSAHLTLTGVEAAQAGAYSVEVANPAGNVISSNIVLTVRAGPLITSQPMSQSVIEEGAVVFNVVAIGEAPLGYQWRFNGTNLVDDPSLSGAATPTLTLSNVQSFQSGQYSVVVSNAVKSVTSANAFLAVLTPPVFTSQPASQTAVAGSTVTFTFGISGSSPLRYQWLRNGANLTDSAGVSGAMTSRLILDNVKESDAGNYSVIASNELGHATSSTAVLTVITPVTITSQPAAQQVALHAEAHFSVRATGTAPLSYHWRFNGSPLTDGGSTHGATTPDLSLADVQPAHAGTYSVMVSNAAGEILSSDAILLVSIPPEITSQPESQIVLAGSNVSFHVNLGGSAPMSCQWLFNGAHLVDGGGVSGAETPTLLLTDVQQAQMGAYAVSVSNAAGTVLSSNAVLTVITPATITTQPLRQTVDAGDKASFSVAAEGTMPLSYQWRFNGANLADGNGVSGATTASLSISNVQAAQTGSYSVMVSNAVQSVLSSNAALALSVVVPLAEALDTPGWVWTTGGLGSWTGRTGASHDGIDAARSAPVGDAQYTWIKTSGTGSGTLTFWWKVSSEAGRDFLRFMTNGVDVTRISGEVDWQFQTMSVPAGSIELQWRYSKNPSLSNGQDRGWVDQVAFVADSVVKPTVVRISIAGTQVNLTWESKPGKVYQVLYKDNINDTVWKALGNNVEVNGSTASVSDAVVGKPQRFYLISEQ